MSHRRRSAMRKSRWLNVRVAMAQRSGLRAARLLPPQHGAPLLTELANRMSVGPACRRDEIRQVVSFCTRRVARAWYTCRWHSHKRLMDLTHTLARILNAQLGPAYPAESFGAATPLLGEVPELDSMAVVGILAAIEDETGIAIPDDEVSADAFATFSSLQAFVKRQLDAAA